MENLTEDSFKQFIESIFVNILSPQQDVFEKSLNKEEFKDNIVQLKQDFAFISNAILSTAKSCNISDTNLTSILEESTNKIHEKQINYIVNVYKKYSSRINETLNKFQISFPQLIDSQWRLDYIIKSSSDIKISSVGHHVFNVCLKTLNPNGTNRIIEFVCNPEQMKDFYSKTNDALQQMNITNK